MFRTCRSFPAVQVLEDLSLFHVGVVPLSQWFRGLLHSKWRAEALQIVWTTGLVIRSYNTCSYIKALYGPCTLDVVQCIDITVSEHENE